MPTGLIRGTIGLAVTICALSAAAQPAQAQSTGRAVFVAHYFPVNSVSPIGATVAAFRISPEGAATLVENEPSGEWTQSLALSPNGRYLASANGTSATIQEELRIFRVEPDASLTPVFQGFTADSPLDMVWFSDTILAVTRTQQGGSFIRTYRFNDQTTPPTLVLADEEPTGYFNSSVCRHPSGPWIYTQDSGVFGGTRSVKQWAVAPDGTLTDLGSAPSSDPPLKPSISPNGRWMYTGTGAFGAGTVAGFTLDPVTGAPVEMPGSPFLSPGGTPYRVVVSRDNRFAFVGHTVDETIRPFWIDPGTGALTPTGFTFTAGPRLSLGPIATLDDLLIVLKDSNDPIGMWVMGINSTNGNLAQIGPLYDTGNRRPELAMVTWSPPAPVCRPDIDGDGQIGVQDIFDFLALWFAADSAADFDGSGGVGLDDLFAFLAAWFNGCG